MDIIEAKNEVIKAGHQLLNAGLIARTWGNISCRISDSQFVITPSGRAYDSLTLEDIVVVNIMDLSHEGDVKPSSEKGIHASCYKLRPEINFVIHTHQNNASVHSVLNSDIKVAKEYQNILGPKVMMAEYGLPGTKKLMKNVANAVQKNPSSSAVIMANHGTVCMGKNLEDAFLVAMTLEKVCGTYFKSKIYASYDEKNVEFIHSTRESIHMSNLSKEEKENHQKIYAARPDINYIVHSKDPYSVFISKQKKTVKPLLDDFAQLIGTNLKVAEANQPSFAQETKKRNALLINGQGAFCYAATEGDAQAVAMITDKQCKALTEAQLLGSPRYIGGLDSKLMRFVYLKKYSKQMK
jgi:L-fuculose-phosphate aldolase